MTERIEIYRGVFMGLKEYINGKKNA